MLSRALRHQKILVYFNCLEGKNGAPEGIRTPGLCLRRAALYPAELRVLRGRLDSAFASARQLRPRRGAPTPFSRHADRPHMSAAGGLTAPGAAPIVRRHSRQLTPSMSETKSKAKKASTSTVPAGEATPIIKGSHVYLVDGSGYIFRAFHALPPLTRPSDGLPVGAVHGFCAMLWKLLRETKASEAPTHFAVIFDASEKTFRNEIYEDYKAHRPPPPEELVPQFPLIRDAVKAFNVACIEQHGFEADDLIATYAREVVDAGGDVTIVSSDKDLMQLVRPGVVMLDAMKAKKHRPRRGDREVRRAARQGRRRAVAGRRFDRQRARRAGHRRQDGGRADQRVRRPRRAAGARRRDQAAEAAREAHRVRRPGAHLARARSPQGRRAGNDPDRRASACAIPSRRRCSASCARWSSAR